jgi:TPR repeat protein
MSSDNAIETQDVRMARLRRAWQNGTVPTPQAMQLAERCAEAGLVEAQYILGLMLCSSGQAGDKEQARHWFQTAADRGHSEACMRLWVMALREGGARVCDGDGVRVSTAASATDAVCVGDAVWVRALEHLRRAAALGNDRAIDSLIEFHGNPLEPNEPHLLGYLQHHASLGGAWAQFRLGQAYDQGCLGLERNPTRAFELYLLSAQQGNDRAQCCIGIMYGLGEGVRKDHEQAVHWYWQAARQGNAQAQCNIGFFVRDWKDAASEIDARSQPLVSTRGHARLCSSAI